ncbi:hypothetical protein ACTWPB_16650 [Nocardia sp. IBHARD005]|uniref:hypothetical protein n=1 Tax=Nocardia sp. IBHARD005 TaxID=3457765 RepID=UPI0040590B3C
MSACHCLLDVAGRPVSGRVHERDDREGRRYVRGVDGRIVILRGELGEPLDGVAEHREIGCRRVVGPQGVHRPDEHVEVSAALLVRSPRSGVQLCHSFGAARDEPGGSRLVGAHVFGYRRVDDGHGLLAAALVISATVLRRQHTSEDAPVAQAVPVL